MNLLQEIITYIKNSHKKYPHIEDNINKINILKKIYYDIDNIFKLKKGKNTELTNKQKNTISEIRKNKINISGGFCWLKRKNLYINNVVKLTIYNLYPVIIKLLTKSKVFDDSFIKKYYLESYSYLIDNKDYIKTKLSKTEYKYFKIILNYKFGLIKNNKNYITSFVCSIFSKILVIDEYNDIVYIDTDEIFFCKNKELYNKINNYINHLFNIECETTKTYYFIAKKKYIRFDDLNSVKIKGIRESYYYKNKELKNTVYKLFLKDNIEYNDFVHPKNKELRDEYFRRYKTSLTRMKKLKRVLCKRKLSA